MIRGPHYAGTATGIAAATFIAGAWMLAGSADNIGVFNEDGNGLFQLSLVLLAISALSMLVGGMLIANRVPSFLEMHHLLIRSASIVAASGALLMTAAWALIPNLHVDRLQEMGDIGEDLGRYQLLATEIVHNTGTGLTIASLGVAAIAFQVAVNAKGSMPAYIHWPVFGGALWSVATGVLLVAQIIQPSWASMIPTVVAGAIFAVGIGSAQWAPGATEA